MVTLSWNLQVERGAASATWKPKTIFRALARISRYWAVDFKQDTRNPNPNFAFILTNRRPDPTWAMWTTGYRVYVPGAFKWANEDQQVIAATHEMGHVYGSKGHAPYGNVMAPALGFPYQQFTQVDSSQWFKFGWRKGMPKPWMEPDYWKSHQTLDTLDSGMPLIQFGHGSWLDTVRDFFVRRDIQEITE